MGGIFQKLFNLYAGEEKNAILFAVLAFLWSLGSYCGVTLSDGMFLEHVGAKSLPQAYFFTAIVLFGIATLFLQAFNLFNPYKIYLAAISIGVVGFCILLFNEPAANDNNSYFWIVFKVFCNVFTVVLTTCFWSFIDQYYNLQNAKRLFSLFNATIFLGNACGATLLALSLNMIGIKGLILVISTLLLATGGWVIFISRKSRALIDDTTEGHAVPAKQSFKFIWKEIINSRFTIILMVTYLMIQLINIVTEYTYMQSFDQFFDSPDGSLNGEENRLTTFLGQCTAIIAIANMLYGFFFYSRTVNRFGVNNIVGVSSVFFLITFVGWSFSNALIVAILGIVVVEGISYTIDENNSNLLLNAVPSKIKNKVRVAIDSFFEPLGMLVSALLFLFLDLSSKTLGLYLTVSCLALILLIRGEYRKAILNNLLENAIHFERKAKDWLIGLNNREKKAAKSRLMLILRQLNEPSQLLAYEILLQFHDPKILPRLLNHFQKMSIKGRIKVIELLGRSPFANEPKVIERLHNWLEERGNFSMRSTIHLYLAKRGLLQPEKMLKDIQNKDLTIRGAALIALKLSNNSALHAHLCHANDQLKLLLESSNSEEICMGILILGLEQKTSNIDRLIPFLRHPSPIISCESMRAIAFLIDKSCFRYSTLLFSLLKSSSDNEFRLECLQALGKMNDSSLVQPIILASLHFRPNERRLAESIITQIGLRTVPMLLSLATDTRIHHRCRMLAGRALGRLSLPQLRANLGRIIHIEIERAFFYFYHSKSIQEQYPDRDLSILQDALMTGYGSIIEFVIQLLGVAGSIEDCELLSRSLKSKNPKTRAHAIETLEKTCEHRIFQMLKPLIDERPQSEKLKLYQKRKFPILDIEELLDRLESSPSHVDQIIALTLKAKYNISDWRISLRKQMESDEEIFHHFAYELLET